MTSLPRTSLKPHGMLEKFRAKRKALANYEKDKSNSNLDKLRKCRNEATRQRRRAISPYWRDKSNHLKENPTDFYRTFMPFLGSKHDNKQIVGTLTTDMSKAFDSMHPALLLSKIQSLWFSRKPNQTVA